MYTARVYRDHAHLQIHIYRAREYCWCWYHICGSSDERPHWCLCVWIRCASSMHTCGQTAQVYVIHNNQEPEKSFIREHSPDFKKSIFLCAVIHLSYQSCPSPSSLIWCVTMILFFNDLSLCSTCICTYVRPHALKYLGKP
jgi:hypothetical protein